MPDQPRIEATEGESGAAMRRPPTYDGRTNMEYTAPGMSAWAKDAWEEIQRLQAKLDRLREDYEARAEWAANQKDNWFAEQIALLRAFPEKEFGEFTDGDLAQVLRLSPPASRHIVKSAWNGWFTWGYRTRRIPGNPVGLLPAMKYKPGRAYDIFTEAETEAACALPLPDGPLMEILFWAGLRRAEARNLTGKRVNFNGGYILVKEGAKGSRERKVPMIGRVASSLVDLFTLEGIGPDDHLWYMNPGGGRTSRVRPIGDTTFDTWWTRNLEAAGVRRRRPHMSRHTFATRLFELGMPTKRVQLLLGHESSATTEDTYIHVSDGDLAAEFRTLVGDAQA